MENSTNTFREMNLVLQLVLKSRIKNKTVKENRVQFLLHLFCPQEISLISVFYPNAYIEQTFRIYILLLLKNITSYTCCLFLKPSKTFSLSLSAMINNVSNSFVFPNQPKITQLTKWIRIKEGLFHDIKYTNQRITCTCT